MRLDRLLFFLRFTRTRAAAQHWIDGGHIRRNGERVVRCDQRITAGDVLTLPLPLRVDVIEIVRLPGRRGPAAEARTCYRPLDAPGAIDIAGQGNAPAEGSALP